MSYGQITFARTVRPGDEVLHGGQFSRVTKIRKAQGRKPKAGENLHIVTENDDILKFNSADPLRIRRPAS